MIDEHHADPICKFQFKMGGNVYLPHVAGPVVITPTKSLQIAAYLKKKVMQR
jgi:hypothetical protein